MKLGNSEHILSVRRGVHLPYDDSENAYLLPACDSWVGERLGEGCAGLRGAGLGPPFWTRLGDSCFVTWGTGVCSGGVVGLPFRVTGFRRHWQLV